MLLAFAAVLITSVDAMILMTAHQVKFVTWAITSVTLLAYLSNKIVQLTMETTSTPVVLLVFAAAQITSVDVQVTVNAHQVKYVTVITSATVLACLSMMTKIVHQTMGLH